MQTIAGLAAPTGLPTRARVTDAQLKARRPPQATALQSGSTDRGNIRLAERRCTLPNGLAAVVAAVFYSSAISSSTYFLARSAGLTCEQSGLASGIAGSFAGALAGWMVSLAPSRQQGPSLATGAEQRRLADLAPAQEGDRAPPSLASARASSFQMGTPEAAPMPPIQHRHLPTSEEESGGPEEARELAIEFKRPPRGLATHPMWLSQATAKEESLVSMPPRPAHQPGPSSGRADLPLSGDESGAMRVAGTRTARRRPRHAQGPLQASPAGARLGPIESAQPIAHQGAGRRSWKE